MIFTAGNKKVAYFRFNMSNIDTRFEEVVEFTKKQFEEKLKIHFDDHKLYYIAWEHHAILTQRNCQCEKRSKGEVYRSLTDVDIVFLAGGTCNIPFIKRWIGEQFPKAKLIIDECLETITATGAAIHSLQILNGEVESYI